jgi:glycosyltransferase involved in cell wall biosynthesis
MLDKPLISVLMAVNRDDGKLGKTIDSVLTQSYVHFEFIIINDGTNYEVNQIVESFKDKRIRLYNINKSGLTKSLNYGLKQVKGDFIARQDAGDISLSERLNKQINKFNEDPHLGLLGTSIRNESLNGEFLGNTIFPQNNSEIKDHIGFQNTFWHGTVVLRKSISDKLEGYREQFKMAQDYDFWLRVIENYKVGNLEEILYVRVVDKNSISIKTKNIQSLYGEIARKAYLSRMNGNTEDLTKLYGIGSEINRAKLSESKIDSDYHFYCGRLLLTQRNKKFARKNFLISIKLWPLNFLPWSFYVITLFPVTCLNRIEKIWKPIQKKIGLQII